jgi:Flp pilus assembly protein TadD
VDNRVIYAKKILDAGNTSAAMQVLRQRLGMAPSDVDALHLYATAQMRAGQLSGAAQTWIRLIRLRPGSAQAHYQLGITLQRMGRLAEARTAFANAASLSGERRRT